MHFVQVLLVHLWLFFILPGTSLRPFNHAVYPQMFYMVIAAYYLFSAYQIRCGFPLRVFGNVICQGYNVHNFVLFKVYMNIPFLFEIRGIMDWMFTTTSMKLITFLTMESIFSHVFELECYGTLEEMFGHPSAIQIRSRYKWWAGGFYLALIFAVIWFPLIIFTVGSAVGTPNLPYSVSVSVDVAGHATLYRSSVHDTHIFGLTVENWVNLKQLYEGDRRATSFLRNYENTDVAVIFIEANSNTVWEATPVDQRKLETTVRDTGEPLTFTLKWQVNRLSKDNTYTGTSSGSRQWVLSGDDPRRQALSNVLSYNSTVPFSMPKMIPKFLEVTNQDKADPIFYLVPNANTMEDAFRDMKMRLYVDNNTMQDWWEIREGNCTNPPELLGQLPFFRPDCQNVYIYTFNERMLPLTLSRLISGQGIIALYLTFVYVIGLFIRSLTVTSVNDIMFVEIPYVERLLQLCTNIYLAREYKELALEEYLYSQLLFLFRSPETFIKWVRPVEEEDDDDDDDDDDDEETQVSQ